MKTIHIKRISFFCKTYSIVFMSILTLLTNHLCAQDCLKDFKGEFDSYEVLEYSGNYEGEVFIAGTVNGKTGCFGGWAFLSENNLMKLSFDKVNSPDEHELIDCSCSKNESNEIVSTNTDAPCMFRINKIDGLYIEVEIISEYPENKTECDGLKKGDKFTLILIDLRGKEKE